MSEWSPEHHSTSTKSWSHPVCGIHAARSTNQVKVLALGCTPRVSSAVIAMTFVLQRFLWIVVNRLHASNSWQSRDLRAIFITHQHSDDNAGYGPLFLLGWITQKRLLHWRRALTSSSTKRSTDRTSSRAMRRSRALIASTSLPVIRTLKTSAA